MGGEFTGGKGQQDSAKGIYCLAGMLLSFPQTLLEAYSITVGPVLKRKIMFKRNSDSLKFTFLTKNIASESQFQTYELIVAKFLKACFTTCNCGIRTDFGLKWYK